MNQIIVQKQTRNLEWLKESLQVAIALEHATLPLYLSAMFSLEVQNYTTYNLIRSVVMEEMVHMAIACNILSIIGGKPKIKNLAPIFPGKGLPGGAEPDLEVVLAKLSHKQLENFMRLEVPKSLLPEVFKSEEYPSIGALYTAIKEAIQENSEELTELIEKVSSAKEDVYSNQVGDNIGFTTFGYKKGIDPILQLLNGIDEIIEQGEGSGTNDLWTGDAFEDEASHYARFGELYYGRHLQEPKSKITLNTKNLPKFFKGHQISWPVVTNILAVPSDGYEKILALDPNEKVVRKALDNFDVNYTGIMDDLEAMWNGPASESWPKFGKAVGAMTEMRVQSCFYIMRHEIPKNIINKLQELYPEEYDLLFKYTNLEEPVFYGPRFINNNK